MPQNTSASLNITVVSETYPPEINGVANTMRQLVEGLMRHGHQVTLVRPRQQTDRSRATTEPDQVPAQLLVPGLPIPGYRGLRFGMPVYWRLRHLWKRHPPDAIYVATQGPLGRAALNAARARDIAVLTGFHTQFHQYSRHYGMGLLTRTIVNSLRNFHNRSDGTLVPTSALEHELNEDGFRNVHVFSRGVDTELFSPARRCADLRRNWGCDDTSPRGDVVALYVGRIAAEKNIGLALEAFDALTSAHAHAYCVLVGDGPELARLRALHPGFIFTGAKIGEELARHYASADYFVFPSLTETFGNVVLEAMASALPVVAFDYAAAHEHIRNWKNGVLVPTSDRTGFIDATVAAASDRDRLQRMGAQARASAESLSWDRVIGGVEQRLYEVIQHHRDARGRHENLAATTK
jgi:glycosyltransferase involved in cell wall biosynthesis